MRLKTTYEIAPIEIKNEPPKFYIVRTEWILWGTFSWSYQYIGRGGYEGVPFETIDEVEDFLRLLGL